MKKLQLVTVIAAVLILFSCKGNNQPAPIELATASPTVVKKPVKPATIQIALLLDTSNSMDGLINQAKDQLWDIVTQMSYAHCNETQAQLEIALYEYGNSNLSSQSDYIRQVLPFSTDLDIISKELFALRTKGGDEYCGAVIKDAVDHLEWRDGAQDLKMIFIAGNESFYQGSVSSEFAMGMAVQNDITVNTIFCGERTNGINLKWKDSALLGKGEYTFINHNQQAQYVATPYDDQIIQLNSKLNNTYVVYGYRAQEAQSLQSRMDERVAGVSVQSNVKRTVAKSTKAYSNSSWDLIDAAADEEELEELIVKNKETLSADLKDKTVEEVKAITLEKKKERDAIQTQIQQLNKQREAYVASNSKNESGGLETALLKALKKQAAGKNYTWKKES